MRTSSAPKSGGRRVQKHVRMPPMKVMKLRHVLAAGRIGLLIRVGRKSPPGHAQAATAAPGTASAQRIDDEYTRLIKQHLQDPRISTALVDHLPASETVPTPLKFLGRAVGTPGELTYAKDIRRYYA